MSNNLSGKNIISDWRRNNKSIEKYSFVYSFLSHPEGKRRAGLLSPKALSIYTLVLCSILAAFKFLPKYVPGILGYASNIHVRELLDYTNKKRLEAGLSELRLNNELSQAAYAKAKDMFEDDYWAHVAPDGTEPWDFIVSAGYDYSYAGENLAKNFSNSAEVVEAWYKSDSHRENLLGSQYEDVGFAVVDGVLDGYETTLVVQTFGKSRTPSYLSSSVPETAQQPELEIIEEKAPAVSVSLPEPAPVAEVVLPALDITSASKFLNIGFGLFLVLLLIFDLWYSHRKGIRKISGHTLAHILFLIFAFVGMWFALSPGKIL